MLKRQTLHVTICIALEMPGAAACQLVIWYDRARTGQYVLGSSILELWTKTSSLIKHQHTSTQRFDTAIMEDTSSLADLCRLVEHLGRPANLPAVEDSARLFTSIQALTEQVAALSRVVEREFAEMRTQIRVS